jgi:hypothetical protein
VVEGLVTSLVGRRTTAMARRSSFRVQHLDERIPVPLGGESHEPLPDADSDECPQTQTPPPRPLCCPNEEPFFAETSPFLGY